MKQTISTRACVLLLIAMFAITPTFATAHTLEWGVEVGDEFTYALQNREIEVGYENVIPYWMTFVFVLEEGQKFVATITELEDIPIENPVVGDLPVAHAALSHENDSSNIQADTTAFAIMINDWEFQTEMLNLTENSWISPIDSETEWGIVDASYFTMDGVTYEYSLEWRYDITTGALTYTRYKVSTLGNTPVDIVFSQWEEGDPTILPDELELSTILIYALAGVVFVIVAFLAYRWVKKPKGLAAELGR